jgi:hypothetical protein
MLSLSPANGERAFVARLMDELHGIAGSIKAGGTSSMTIVQEIAWAKAFEVARLLCTSMGYSQRDARMLVDGWIAQVCDVRLKWDDVNRWFNHLDEFSEGARLVSPRVYAHFVREEFDRTPKEERLAMLRFEIVASFDDRSKIAAAPKKVRPAARKADV